MPHGWTGSLLFTEVAGEHRFRDLAERAVGRGGWTVDATVEDASLIVGRGDAPELVLVAGRQLRARGGLEVLALGSAAEFADGLPLTEAVDAAGALAVVPWGFGKWWFGRWRGRSIRRSRAGCSSATTATGSACCRRRRCSATRSGGRCGCCPSDPLPLRSEGDKVRRYGFVLDGVVSRVTPARNPIGPLRAGAAQPRTFGRLEAMVPFVRNQVLPGRARAATKRFPILVRNPAGYNPFIERRSDLGVLNVNSPSPDTHLTPPRRCSARQQGRTAASAHG